MECGEKTAQGNMERKKVLCSNQWTSNSAKAFAIIAIFIIGLQAVHPKVSRLLPYFPYANCRHRTGVKCAVCESEFSLQIRRIFGLLRRKSKRQKKLMKKNAAKIFGCTWIWNFAIFRVVCEFSAYLIWSWKCDSITSYVLCLHIPCELFLTSGINVFVVWKRETELHMYGL